MKLKESKSLNSRNTKNTITIGTTSRNELMEKKESNKRDDEDISNEKLKENVEPMVERMKDKIGNFENNYEMEGGDNKEENEEEQEQEQGQIVMDLMNNKEVLEIRRKELEDIHKTSALIKDTTDIMAVKVKEQADMLDNIENNVIKTEDNVDKANKEIIKANELSKSNNKRLCCIMLIVTVAIGVVLAIVLSLVL